MDGAGYGLDGDAWGGESFIANETTFQRFGHLQYLVAPGGEKAIHEPWRIAASCCLKTAFGQSWQEIALRLNLVPDQKSSELLDRIIERRLNSPLFQDSAGILMV